jgi:nucleotide-binding universal stress UspA family protein
VNAPPALKLLVAVDGSAPSLRAVDYALRLCAEAPSAELYVVNVQAPLLYVEELLGPREALVAHWSAVGAHEALRAAREAIERAGRVAQVEIIDGAPAEAIVARARELGADLILLGTRGLNPVRELVLGSVAKFVLAQADCPAVVVR